ncbi:MAG: Rieske 2Fe-2S domain-containing protein [Candidatus Limnocylindrales bacterium]|jgi:nitrite reductase/ring-hydroxylating ferredoxin subunit
MTGPAGSVRRIDLCAVAEVPPGTMKLCAVDGEFVLVTNVDGTFHAAQGVCSHEYFELDRGVLTGDSILCTLHLSRFSVVDGDVIDPPAELPLAVYPVIVERGRVLVEVPAGPLAVNR